MKKNVLTPRSGPAARHMEDRRVIDRLTLLAKDEQQRRFNMKVPGLLHRQMRRYCYEHDTTMTHETIDFWIRKLRKAGMWPIPQEDDRSP